VSASVPEYRAPFKLASCTVMVGCVLRAAAGGWSSRREMSTSSAGIIEAPGGAHHELRTSLRKIFDDWWRSAPALLAARIASCLDGIAGIEDPDIDGEDDVDADVRPKGCTLLSTEAEPELDDSDAGVNIDDATDSDSVGEAGAWLFKVSVSNSESEPQ
jgi:hypothetical protein